MLGRPKCPSCEIALDYLLIIVARGLEEGMCCSCFQKGQEGKKQQAGYHLISWGIKEATNPGNHFTYAKEKEVIEISRYRFTNMKSWLIIYREMGRKRRVVGTVSSISVRLNTLFPIRSLYELLPVKYGLD